MGEDSIKLQAGKLFVMPPGGGEPVLIAEIPAATLTVDMPNDPPEERRQF